LTHEREQSVYRIASEGAKLEAQRHSASLCERNASYERSVVAKEREALIDHQRALEAQQQEADAARRSLYETSDKLQSARDAICALVDETEDRRGQVTNLAERTALEAEAIVERQRQLQEQTAALLRSEKEGQSSTKPATVGANEGGVASGANIARTNYTTSALGAFALPLDATRTVGLSSSCIGEIDAAARTVTSHATFGRCTDGE